MAKKKSFTRRAKTAGMRILPPVMIGLGSFGGVVASDAIEGSSWTLDQMKFARIGIGAGAILIPAFIKMNPVFKNALFGLGAYLFGRGLATQFNFAGSHSAPIKSGLVREVI